MRNAFVFQLWLEYKGVSAPEFSRLSKAAKKADRHGRSVGRHKPAKWVTLLRKSDPDNELLRELDPLWRKLHKEIRGECPIYFEGLKAPTK